MDDDLEVGDARSEATVFTTAVPPPRLTVGDHLAGNWITRDEQLEGDSASTAAAVDLLASIGELLGLASQFDRASLLDPDQTLQIFRNKVSAVSQLGYLVGSLGPAAHAEAGRMIVRSASFKALMNAVDVAKQQHINAVDGPLFQMGILLMQALDWVQTRVLLQPASAPDGWEMDVIRLGLLNSSGGPWLASISEARPVIQTGIWTPYRDKLREWTSNDLLLSEVDLSSSYMDAIHQVNNFPPGVARRRTARMVAAILKASEFIRTMPAWDAVQLGMRLEAINANYTLQIRTDFADADSQRFLESESPVTLEKLHMHLVAIEYVNSTGAVVSVDSPTVWIDRMIQRYFSVGLPNSLWRYSDESLKLIRPARRSELPADMPEKQRRRSLLACGRLLAMALRKSVTAGVNLSPATRSLLVTVPSEDLDQVAMAENRAMWSAIDSLRGSVQWSNVEAVREVFPDAAIDDSAIPINETTVDRYLRHKRIEDIVLSIHAEVRIIREGFYQVFPRRDHLDPLPDRDLNSFLRAPTGVLTHTVISGTHFSSEEGVDEDRSIRWFKSVVEQMSDDDRALLVRFITGLRHPPISVNQVAWMHVHFCASGHVVSDSTLPRVNGVSTLWVPQYSSQIRLAAAIVTAITAPPSCH